MWCFTEAELIIKTSPDADALCAWAPLKQATTPMLFLKIMDCLSKSNLILPKLFWSWNQKPSQPQDLIFVQRGQTTIK